MSDTRTIIDHMRLKYEGPIHLSEFFPAVQRFLKERGYEKADWDTYEFHDDKGIGIDWVLFPFKKISSEIRYTLKIKAYFREMKPIKATKKKTKTKEVFTGKLDVWLDAILESDYEHRWEMRPMLQMIRWLFDRFIFVSYTERFEQRLTSDAHDLYAFLEQYLNLTRTEYKPTNLPRF